MPKKLDIDNTESFGQRMARFRQAAGYSQRDLAKKTGISQRMIAYYEKQAKYPPTHFLPALVKALGTTADELLGIKKSKNGSKKKTCVFGEGSAKLKIWMPRKKDKYCCF